ncbi:MAG: hypothetical protein JJT94_09850 [Bernardetiaceae bacterium]|nr:hypothetical protein [Bernardetiaceae bacterium]
MMENPTSQNEEIKNTNSTTLSEEIKETQPSTDKTENTDDGDEIEHLREEVRNRYQRFLGCGG